MSQAAFSLPQFSPFELLLADYEVATAEKDYAYELWHGAWAATGGGGAAVDAVDAAEAACDAAYDAVEAVTDMILALPARSSSEVAIKARVLSARGADPADLFYYRPQDLTRFVQEVRGLAQL